MNTTTTDYLLRVLAIALGALVLGFWDAFRFASPCGIGVLSIRALAAGALLGALQAAIFLGVKKSGHRRWLILLLLLVAAAPASIWSSIHLTNTATISRMLDFGAAMGILLPIILLLEASFFAVQSRLVTVPPAHLANRIIWTVLTGALGAGLFFLSIRHRELHPALAINAALTSLLCLQSAFYLILTALVRRTIHRIAVVVSGVIFVVLTAAGAIVPVSTTDAFTASDKSVFANSLSRMGRSESLDDLLARFSDDTPLDDRRSARKHLLHKMTLPHLPGRSVLLISADALRADHVGHYGYSRPTTPFLDSLAAKSVVFENTYSSSATSCFSIPSLLTGRHMEVTIKSMGNLPPTIADKLSARGYTTAALYSNKTFSVGRKRMARVKATRFGFERAIISSEDAADDVARFRQLFRRKTDRPVFAWVHLFDPHHPYECHDQPFGSEPIDCYDAEIQYMDRAIEDLVTWAEKALKDPIIIFTADHGDAFNEHGKLYHSTDLYDEQVKVPLFIHVPNVPPRRVSTPVTNVQLAGTIEALVADEPLWHDDDLRPLLVADVPGEPIPLGMWNKKGIVDGHHKLICNRLPQGPCALYDLSSDPGESKNVANQHPETTSRLLKHLIRIHREQIKEAKNEIPLVISQARLGKPGIESELARLGASDDSSYGVEAVSRLALMRSRQGRSKLQAFESSPHPDKAAWACIGLVYLEQSCATDRLVPLMSRDSLLGVHSAVALGMTKDQRALAPLLRHLRNGDIDTRHFIIEALGKLGRQDAIGPLTEALENQDTRKDAAAALERLKETE